MSYRPPSSAEIRVMSRATLDSELRKAVQEVRALWKERRELLDKIKRDSRANGKVPYKTPAELRVEARRDRIKPVP